MYEITKSSQLNKENSDKSNFPANQVYVNLLHMHMIEFKIFQDERYVRP